MNLKSIVFYAEKGRIMKRSGAAFPVLLALGWGANQAFLRADETPAATASNAPASLAAPVRLSSPPDAGRGWRTNSLGMVFAPAPNPQVLFSIWETRVQDFAVFAAAVNFTAPDPIAVRSDVRSSERDWRHPGFPQNPAHPVVFVSWEDARRFCEWLTQKEQAAGRLETHQRYRLPTDAEWSQAAGAGKYPWSEMLPPRAISVSNAAATRSGADDDRRFFPPPAGAGNYAGTEFRALDTSFRSLKGYTDGYLQTSPAGHFTANRHGLCDLGGNVWEWCEDWYHKEMLTKELESKLPFYNEDGGGKTFRVLRGASWLDSNPAILRSDCRFFEFPDLRNDNIGFRVVLDCGSLQK